MQRRAALTPKKCPGQLSQVPTLKRLREYGISVEEINIMQMDSRVITSRSLAVRNASAFRILSIDGGHTLGTTLNDLNLAACIVRDGAVVVVDDFINKGWLGVPHAVFLFTSLQHKLVPFLWFFNKMYFTTAPYHERYLIEVKNRTSGLICTGDAIAGHESRIMFGRHRLCIA
jgi:hypothetical protein